MKRMIIDKFSFSINADENYAMNNGVKGKEVTIPHTWSITNEAENFIGTAWYSTNIKISRPSLRTFLFFHGVYRDCHVYINGKLAAAHTASGYTPFEVDITDFIKQGDNLLAVKCNNNFSPHALPHGKAFDWASDGGIIRKVELIEYDKNCARNIVIQSKVMDFLGNGKCTAKIKYNAEMLECATASYILRIKDWATKEVLLEKHLCVSEYEFDMKNAKLWDVEKPNLYVLEMDYGDALTTKRFGIRKIETRGNKVYLNNRELRLIAVEWMPGSNPNYGMAEPESELVKNLEMLKDLNCNFTRFHWQQDDFVFDWCDEHGLLVQEEIPYWGFPKKAGSKQLEIAKTQADEMLHYHYNHPSIICWGVGNELNGWSKETIGYVKEMVSFFKSKDSTRLANYVSNTLGKSRLLCRLLSRREATSFGDICMWNEYLGTWQPTLNMESTFKYALRNTMGKPLVITEFGLCEPRFKGGDQRRINVYEKKLSLYEKYNISGWVYFCLNDYRTHMGENGTGKYKQRIHGSVDLNGNKKPSYYFIKKKNE